MTPVLLIVAAALVACGDTLVDHRADIRQGPGGVVCVDPGLVSCRVDGADACKVENVQFCGGGCDDCRSAAVPAGAVPACVGMPGGTCGYECTGGLLKCVSGGEPACCTATALSAGAAHTCAVTAGGGLFCWGANDEGQVTGTPGAPVTTPRKRRDVGVTAVAAGEGHTCAVVSGEVRCWGRGFAIPETVVTVAAGATALAAGGQHTCALVGGAVRCWGAGEAVGDGSPIATDATAIAAGRDHSCAVVLGAVRCWGSRAQGQLGDGETTGSSAAPVTVPALSGIELLAAGDFHTCATAAAPSGEPSDALRCWGDAPRTPFVPADVQTTPAIPTRPGGTRAIVQDRVARIDSGRTHICYQRTGAGQSIQCLGPENGAGQLGGLPEPGREVDVPGTLGAAALAAGGDHACAVLAGGGLSCWGLNDRGQLGDGTTATPPAGTLVPVSGR